MRAKVGDRIVLAAEQVDRPTRAGEVVEVRGSDGNPPYLISWDDGHSGLIYPGPGSILRVVGTGQEPVGEVEQAAAGAGPMHVWTVQITVFGGDDSTANAVLVADPATKLRASGASHRRASDPAEPRIGEEIAVSRALRHLADQLLDTATGDVRTATGAGDVHIKPF